MLASAKDTLVNGLGKLDIAGAASRNDGAVQSGKDDAVQSDGKDAVQGGASGALQSDVDGAVDDTRPALRREDVELPKDFKGRLAFVLYNVFTKQECKDLINKTEKMGYEQALVNIGFGRQKLMPDVRNNTRCIWDTVEEADRIWQRIKEHVPAVFNGHQVIGLNERLRFLKYNPGEYFKPHMDGCYRRENGEQSYITIQVYLNEGFEGGSTTFMDYCEENPIEVVPKTGSVLVFQHDIMHEGSTLVSGCKYAIRTDVMFTAEKVPNVTSSS